MATVHVMPMRDLVGHEMDEACVCGPLVDPVLDDTNRVAGFVVVHAALDGREQTERGVRTQVTD